MTTFFLRGGKCTVCSWSCHFNKHLSFSFIYYSISTRLLDSQPVKKGVLVFVLALSALLMNEMKHSSMLE